MKNSTMEITGAEIFIKNIDGKLLDKINADHFFVPSKNPIQSFHLVIDRRKKDGKWVYTLDCGPNQMTFNESISIELIIPQN